MSLRISSDQRVKVFDIRESKKKKRTMDANLSSYKGKDQDDKPIYSRWRANFVGDAYGKAQSDLQEGDVIVLSNAIQDKYYNSEKKIAYYTVIVFDFELYRQHDDSN